MTTPDRHDDFFDERETWPPERWQRFQWRRLRAVTRYAYQQLPFYRRRFDQAGLDPLAVHTPADYARLPLLSKAEVLQAMRGAGTYALGMEHSDPTEPRALGMTSGTLGTSILSFPWAWRRATGDALCRAYWWAGLRPGGRLMMAAPAWHSMAVQESWVVQRLGATCVIPWGTFLPLYTDQFLDTLVDLKPSLVSIFLPMLYALLAECRQRGVSPATAFAGVDAVLPVGAPLTPRARLHLCRELGVRDVFEGAGCPEGLIAMECSAHRGHHYFVDICYVEIIDPETREPLPPGQRGSVVVSSLVPHGSVHLRYNTEDVGEILPEFCRCGRTWPLLEIYDRRANLFRVRDRELLWYDVRVCLDELSELIGVPFAVIRTPRGAPALRLVLQKPPQADPATLEPRLHELVAARLQVPVRTEWVDGLPTRWKGVTVIDEQDWVGSHG